jgi:crotonobetainyl-CoA:carnitine CoA-transferase CaiB-like acyl-CoA transferase
MLGSTGRGWNRSPGHRASPSPYGYGRRGPDRDLRAYVDTIKAECGLPAVQEQLTGEANYVGTIMADKVAGLTALYATTMALFHRERIGEGQEVEVSMFETMASFMLVEHANGAMFDPPLGPPVYPRTVAPNRRPYRTSDGYIAALIYNDKHWSAFVDAVRPAWASDLYSTLERRARRIDTVYALLGETLQERTTQEWLKLFRELQIPAAPLRSPAALFDSDQLDAVGFFETVHTPHGPVRFPGVPTWFSRIPGRVAGPAPELGADTTAVLDELGLADVK